MADIVHLTAVRKDSETVRGNLSGPSADAHIPEAMVSESRAVDLETILCNVDICLLLILIYPVWDPCGLYNDERY